MAGALRMRKRSPGRVGLLLSEDDLHPEGLAFGAVTIAAIASIALADHRAAPVEAFTKAALADARARAAAHFDASAEALPGPTSAAVRDWARSHDLRTVVIPYAPVGPARTALDAIAAELVDDGIAIVSIRRSSKPREFKGLVASWLIFDIRAEDRDNRTISDKYQAR